MPTWNRIDLAKEAIASVYRQTDDNYEFVVVDDGSEDRVKAELKQLADKYQFQLILQENAGPGRARNCGADHARGEYLVFLDSDDVLYPWALETYRDVISSENHPTIIGARFFPVDFNAPPEATHDRLKVNRFPDFLACSRGESFLGACNQIIRRDEFLRVGGFTERPINSEDHELMLRLGTAEGFVRIVSPPTLAYRVHQDNLTAVSERTIAGVRYLLQQERAGNFPGGAARRSERLRILLKHVRPVVLSCLQSGDRSIAWSLYRETWAWNLTHGHWKFLLGFLVKAITPGARHAG